MGPLTWAAAAFGAGAAAYLGPHGTRFGEQRRLQARCSQRRSLVLSYDDGPGAKLTPRLLELLAGHGAAATFFVLGARAQALPELVTRLVDEGHELGSHGRRHVNAWKGLPWTILADIRDGYDDLARWAPADALFRPPYGKVTLANWWATRRRHAPFGWWTIDSLDSHEVPRTAGQTRDVVLERGGGVVLLHDCDRDAERDELVLETTRLLLQAASREGLRVETLGAVMSADA